MSTFKILAFDGGGIKGALSARILLRICEKYPNFLNEIDLFAGTSTGSLIALSLASGRDAKFIDSLYNYSVSKYIFTPRRINFFKPRYSNRRLTKVFSEYFPENLKIKDLKKYVYIPAFNIIGSDEKGWEPIFFHNLCPNETDKFSVIDAALSSTAAPTYFPAHKSFIDGGVVASSPTTVAAFASLSHISSIQNSTNIRILSIGTGDLPNRITSKSVNWGIFQWISNPFSKIISPLTDILLEGSTLIDHMYCTDLFRENYFRINPLISKPIEMDNYRYVPYLKNFANELDLTTLFKFVEDKIITPKSIYKVK